MTLDELLAIPYQENGRTAQGADCYGLTRLARTYIFGKPWMAEHGAVDGTNKRAMTRAVKQDTASIYRECSCRPGAIATAWRASLCTHIALVIEADGRPMILETDEPGRSWTGPRIVPVRQFEKRFTRVIYYDD